MYFDIPPEFLDIHTFIFVLCDIVHLFIFVVCHSWSCERTVHCAFVSACDGRMYIHGYVLQDSGDYLYDDTFICVMSIYGYERIVHSRKYHKQAYTLGYSTHIQLHHAHAHIGSKLKHALTSAWSCVSTA